MTCREEGGDMRHETWRKRLNCLHYACGLYRLFQVLTDLEIDLSLQSLQRLFICMREWVVEQSRSLVGAMDVNSWENISKNSVDAINLINSHSSLPTNEREKDLWAMNLDPITWSNYDTALGEKVGLSTL